MEAQGRPPVVVVTGPTATGKTPVAIELARRFGGEIVNADSMQVYRFMDIGTAKPSAAQRAAVPHHLLDVATPDVNYSAGRYVQAARAAAAQIHARGRIVFLAGGTGLYIRAFLEGLIEGAEADLELRERLESEAEASIAEGDPGRLHRRLARLDPGAAARIHPNDTRRITRALEIAEQTGAPASEVRGSHRFADRPYRVLHLALDLPRARLDERIDARCAAMIEAGLLREMRDLQERGYGVALRSMKAIGYRHMIPVVQGADTLANALVAMQRDTRRFARRQRTWLRRVPEAIWVDASDRDDIAKRVEAFVEAETGTVSRSDHQNGTTV
jgi:tRNA dimethylallyltransferase